MLRREGSHCFKGCQSIAQTDHAVRVGTVLEENAHGGDAALTHSHHERRALVKRGLGGRPCSHDVSNLFRRPRGVRASFVHAGAGVEKKADYFRVTVTPTHVLPFVPVRSRAKAHALDTRRKAACRESQNRKFSSWTPCTCPRGRLRRLPSEEHRRRQRGQTKPPIMKRGVDPSSLPRISIRDMSSCLGSKQTNKQANRMWYKKRIDSVTGPTVFNCDCCPMS
jgi:hypothetical protein